MPDFLEDINKALEQLHTGGVILYPTDTVWGIGCDATNKDAIEKIFLIKKRPPTKAMVVLVADERDVLKYAANVNPEVFDYLESAAKPTTVIYEGALGLAENLIADDGSVAIRIVKDDFCRTLIKRFRKPLVSTSANLSGEVTPGTFSAINQEIRSAVDYVVQHKQDDQTMAVSSSIIRFGQKNEIIVVRD